MCPSAPRVCSEPGGQRPVLSLSLDLIDVLLPSHEANHEVTYTGYIADLRKRMKHVHELVEARMKKSGENRKKWYDVKVRGASLQPGDHVLVRKVGLKGKQKLADRWEEEVCVVTSQPDSSIPVFTVRKLDGRGRSRTLHRNMLLPVKSVPSVPSEECQSTALTPRVTRSRTRARDQAQGVRHSRLAAADRCSSEESLSEAVSIVPQLPTSLLVCKADSSLDLDDDETSVLVEESLARSEDSGTDDGDSGGGGHEADVSGSVLDSGQESRTGDHSTRPHVAPSVWPQLMSSTECSKPRRPVRHRSQPAWMRTGEWHISWSWVSHLSTSSDITLN